MAVVTAAVRSETPSFSKMRIRWVFTVASLMCSSRPMSALDSPRATCGSTSSSRGVSDVAPPAAAPGRPACGATGGASTVSPRAAARTASASSSPRRVLEQVAGRAGLDRPQDVGVGVVRGERPAPGRRAGRGDPAGRGDAVDAGHPQVHQHHVRPQSRGQRDRLGAGRRPRRPPRGPARRRASPRRPSRTTGMVVDHDPTRSADRHLHRGPRPGPLRIDSGAADLLDPVGASRPARTRAVGAAGSKPAPSSATVSDAAHGPSSVTSRTPAGAGVLAHVGQRLLGRAQQHHLRRSAGSGRARRSTRRAGPARPVSAPNRSTSRPIASGSGAACRSTGRQRGDQRPGLGQVLAGRSRSGGGQPLPGRRPDRCPPRTRPARSSTTTEVKPWARVSWISRASRSRSASTPARWLTAASSARVASSSSISRRAADALRDDAGDPDAEQHREHERAAPTARAPPATSASVHDVRGRADADRERSVVASTAAEPVERASRAAA